MQDKIAEVQKGQRPSLLETDKANELIKAINALGQIEIATSQTGEATVEYMGDSIKITVPGMPAGYFEKEIQICEDDAVKTYALLVRGPIA